jgi:mono/diheme cytochrome c family protein
MRRGPAGHVATGKSASTLAAFVLLGLSGAASGTRAADAPGANYPQGAAAFQGNCAVCHGPVGAGVPSLAPPLLAYPARYASSAEGRRQLAMTLLYGMFGDITVGGAHFNSQMPAFAQLDDATLAALLNFVVFDLDHAASETKPLAAAEITAERSRVVDAAAVREHRKQLAPPGP